MEATGATPNSDQLTIFPKISIVLPVYNPDLTDLKKSINSVLAQEGPYELIAIDDGSDKTIGDVLDNYAQIHPKIKVFHQANQGVSNARNLGIRKSTGEYITFLDADDQLTPTMLANALSLIEEANADIVFGGIKKEYTNGTSRLSVQPLDETKYWKLFSGADLQYFKAATFDSRAVTQLGLQPVLYFSCCGTLYRKRLIESLTFNELVKFSEDSVFNWQAISQADTVAVAKGYWYIYQENTSSVTGRVQLDILSLMLPTLEECMKIRATADQELKQYLDNGIYLFCFYRVFFCSIIQFSFTKTFKCTKTHFVKTFLQHPKYSKALNIIRPNEPKSALIAELARKGHYFLVAQIVSLGNRFVRIAQGFREKLS